MMFDNDILIRTMINIIEARKGRALLGMTKEEQKEFMKENKHDFVKAIGDN